MLEVNVWKSCRSLSYCVLILNAAMATLLWTAFGATTEHIYVPDNTLKVNGKTVLTLYKEKVTWNEAASVCEDTFPGGHLVKVDNTPAWRQIIDTQTDDVWIGLYWRDSSTLAWYDPLCQEVQDDSYVYANFKDENEASYDSSKRCYFMKKDDGFWEKKSCSDEFWFVCEHQEFDQGCTPQYDTAQGGFHLETQAGANATSCQQLCSNIVDCFMTAPGSDVCLLGVADSAQTIYVKDQCYSIETKSNLPSFSSNSASNPAQCTQQDIAAISLQLQNGGNVHAINSSGVTNCQCGAVSTVTSISEAVQTTTVTELALSTTTDLITTTHYDQQCTNTLTTYSVEATTVVETETVSQSCSRPSSSPPCLEPSSVIVTVTDTFSDCAVTSLCPSIQPPTVTQTETSVMSCESQTPISCSDVTSTFVSTVNDVIVTTVTTNVVTSTVEDCSVTSSCPALTSSECVTSTVQVVETVTEPGPSCENVDTASHSRPTQTHSSVSLNQDQVDDIVSSIVEELSVDDETLSNKRRKKESAYDKRTSAQVSGYLAIVIICTTFALIMIPDLPALYRHLRYSSLISDLV